MVSTASIVSVVSIVSVFSAVTFLLKKFQPKSILIRYLEYLLKRSKFKKYLYLENPERRCFITQELISDDESVDHVIPWSYLYSDDIWNLVLVKKGANSSKSNKIPEEELINKLEQRNEKLLELTEYESDKQIEELRLAIQNDYVRKFWTGCRG